MWQQLAAQGLNALGQAAGGPNSSGPAVSGAGGAGIYGAPISIGEKYFAPPTNSKVFGSSGVQSTLQIGLIAAAVVGFIYFRRKGG